MHDHVHLLIKPKDPHTLSQILHTIKSFTTNQMQRLHGRHGAVWLHESWDRIVRDENEFLGKLKYILNNPIRRWPDWPDYPWVGAPYLTEDYKNSPWVGKSGASGGTTLLAGGASVPACEGPEANFI